MYCLSSVALSLTNICSNKYGSILEMEPESITNATYYLAKGLLPDTNYTFYIRGYTNEASDPSNTITCQTGNIRLSSIEKTLPYVHYPVQC